MNFLFGPFAAVLKHRTILLRTTFTDLRSLYAGSILGLLWVGLGPLLLLGVYALVYAVIFRVQPSNMTVTEYILYVFSGLVPFIAFTAALSSGALSLTSNKQVLLNTIFPAELIPLRSVLVASAGLPVGLVILLLGDATLSHLTWSFALVPVVMLLQVMFVTGLCWVLSLLTLVVRDIQQVLVYVTMLLLVVTPIAYTPDMIPPKLLFLLYLNPMFYFVIAFQSLVILDQLPSLDVILIGTTMSVVSYVLGYAVCRRTKQAFYDYA